jgi:hypothetical protein
VRTALLKAYSNDGFVFFTHPGTLKVRHMTESPHVSLLFFWPEFNRQIRIDGRASRIPATSLARGFFARGVRHGAITWVSPDGQVADARKALKVFRALLVSNTIMGLVNVLEGVLIWRDGRCGRVWAHGVGSVNLVALLIITTLYVGGSPIAVNSLAAITARTLAWIAAGPALRRAPWRKSARHETHARDPTDWPHHGPLVSNLRRLRPLGQRRPSAFLEAPFIANRATARRRPVTFLCFLHLVKEGA